MISDLKVGTDDYLVGVVTSIREGKTKNGDPFIDLDLADKSASIGVKIWSSSKKDMDDLDIRNGSFIYSKGRVGEYNGKVQFTVDTSQGINIANIKNYPSLQEEYKIEDYIPTAPLSYEEIKDYLLWAIGQIGDDELREFSLEIFKDNEKDLISYPASVNVHHEYVNGLGYHIYRMVKQVLALKTVYDQGVDYDYLIAGAIVHDIGKIHCYELNEIGLPTGYSLENDLHGHIAIGYKMVEEYDLSREKKDMVQHLILSHHGIREYGAVAEPMTIEAQMLHYIDTMDAKVTIIEKELAKLEDEEVSKRLWYLDNNKLYKMPSNPPENLSY